MKWLAVVVGLVMGLCPSSVLASTISLRSGVFYGPGGSGVNPFPDGTINGVTLIGPLTGFIPFFNNGPVAPNVAAEALQGGVVDGRLSNGVLINENDNGAFVLDLRDPETGLSGRVWVGSAAGGPHEGVEILEPDSKNNLTLTVDVALDPGLPELVTRLDARFTTGAVKIPLSLKSQQGLPGGQDHAGPFPSGRVFIGRLGDFDHDGFLDGVFVFAQNPPAELVIGGGDPAFLDRPFSTDISIPSSIAAVLMLNGVVQNFPDPVEETIRDGEKEAMLGYLVDIEERIDASLVHVRRPLGNSQKDRRLWTKLAQRFLLMARSSVRTAIRTVAKGETVDGAESARQGLRLTSAALQLLLAANALAR